MVKFPHVEKISMCQDFHCAKINLLNEFSPTTCIGEIDANFLLAIIFMFALCGAPSGSPQQPTLYTYTVLVYTSAVYIHVHVLALISACNVVYIATERVFSATVI